MILSYTQLWSKRNTKAFSIEISIEKVRNSDYIYSNLTQHILNNVGLARKLWLSMERKTNLQGVKYNYSETFGGQRSFIIVKVIIIN